MVMCQYFLQGRCRFGQNCRYDHSYNNDDRNNRNTTNNTNQTGGSIILQIAKEVLAAEKGGQWPLSCFAPFKEGQNLPGWEDISAEEVRWNLYEARTNGTVNECVNRINQLYSNAEQRRLALKQPTQETLNMLNDLLKEKKIPPIGSTPTNVFSNSSIFSKPNPFDNKSQFRFEVPNSSIFGGSTSPPVSPQPSNTGSMFGGSSSNFSNQSIFSNPQANTTNQGNFFNSQSNAQNVFSSGNNVFSNAQTSSQNVFSNSNQTSDQNIFSNVQTTNQNIFAPANSSAIFSNSDAYQTTGSIFGGQNVFNQNTGVADQNFSNAGQTNIFSKPDAEFQNTQSSFFNEVPSQTNIFNNQSQDFGPSSGLSNQPVQIEAVIYSKVEDLTEDEIKSFTSPTFAFGKIPMKPPAKQYC